VARPRPAQRKKELKAHRVTMYEKALDKLIAGRANPEYVTERWEKLKKIREEK